MFRATRELVAQGHSVIFVSHRLDEVFELCDRVSVFGTAVASGPTRSREIDRQALIVEMLGEIAGARTGGARAHD